MPRVATSHEIDSQVAARLVAGSVEVKVIGEVTTRAIACRRGKLCLVVNTDRTKGIPPFSQEPTSLVLDSLITKVWGREVICPIVEATVVALDGADHLVDGDDPRRYVVVRVAVVGSNWAGLYRIGEEDRPIVGQTIRVAVRLDKGEVAAVKIGDTWFGSVISGVV